MIRSLRRFLTGALALSCGLSCVSAAPAPGASAAAARCVQHGLLNDRALAQEESVMTGAAFLAALARLDDTPLPAAEWASRLALLPSDWSPAAPLTRAQAACLIDRLLTVRGVVLPDAGLPPFSDLAAQSASAAAAITRLQQGGLLCGSGGAFQPDAHLHHAQATLLLDRTWDALTAFRAERLNVTADDGYVLQGKLRLPARTQIDRVVVFLNGSGPNTYDNTRLFGDHPQSYFDVLAELCARQGAAFFSSSTRGVWPAPDEPLYCTIDPAAYQTYLPMQSVRDTESIVHALRAHPALSQAEVWLLGWSEGTMIAPKVAARGKVPVSGLLLAGYVHGTMAQTLDWQQTGGASMVSYCTYFDTDGDGQISPAEWEADPYAVRPALGLSEIPFSALDLDQDGLLTRADLAALLAPSRAALYDAIARQDDAWLAANYPVRLTSAWFRAHDAFPSNREMLTTLSLPVFLFHGEADANVPVQDARDALAQAQAAGRPALTLHTYPGHDHDLNAGVYLLGGTLPQGLHDLFQTLHLD